MRTSKTALRGVCTSSSLPKNQIHTKWARMPTCNWGLGVGVWDFLIPRIARFETNLVQSNRGVGLLQRKFLRACQRHVDGQRLNSQLRKTQMRATRALGKP